MTEFASEQTLMVDYVVTQEDLLSFTIYHAQHSPSLRRSRLIYQIAPSAFLGLFALVWLEVGDVIRAVVHLFLCALWLLFGSRYWFWRVKRQRRRILSEGQKSYPQRQTLAISPAGIWVSSEDTESKMKWSAVEKIVTNEGYIYIYVSPLNALVVPKNMFRSETEYESFVETARRYREASAGLNIEM